MQTFYMSFTPKTIIIFLTKQIEKHKIKQMLEMPSTRHCYCNQISYKMV